MKKSASATVRSPLPVASTTLASSVSSTGAQSPMGEAVTRLPPSVARLRIWRAAKTRSIFASEGYSPASASSMLVSEAAAPMCQASAVAVMRSSSGTASVEISSGNALNFLFSSTPISVAPATSWADGKDSSKVNSPGSDVGRKNFASPAE